METRRMISRCKLNGLFCTKKLSVALMLSLFLTLSATAEESILSNEYGIQLKETVSNEYFDVLRQKEFGSLVNYENSLYYVWNNSNKLQAGTADNYDIKYNIDNTRGFANNLITNDGDLTINENFQGFNLTTHLIDNAGNIDSITADFIANKVTSSSLINNTGIIKDINANFVGNTNGSYYSSYLIKNTGDIDSINGEFINNTGLRSLIINGGHIGEIYGVYIGNSATFALFDYDGKSSDIDSIKGVFINNSLPNKSICELAEIKNGVEGLFVGNKTFNGLFSYAVEMSSLKGDFIDNTSTHGGVSSASFDYAEGNFIGNSATASSGVFQINGVYKNEEGSIIKGNFIDNHAATHGGAILNEGYKVKEISGLFLGNYIENTYSTQKDADTIEFRNVSWGGAITNDNCDDYGIESINADFIKNYVKSVDSPVYAGAISNFYDAGGNIGVVNGNFEGNYTSSTNGSSHGGAYAGRANATIMGMNSNFSENYAYSEILATGGAIYNENSTIGSVVGDFVKNYAISENSNALGGAIHNDNGGVIGGAVSNIYSTQEEGGLTSSFVGNYAQSNSSDKLALGGAIFTSGDVTLFADNKNILMKDNYTEDYRGSLNSGIFVRTNKAVLNSAKSGYDYEEITPTVTLKSVNGGSIVINDIIDGGELYGDLVKGKYEKYEVINDIKREHSYNLAIKGDKNSSIVLNNDVINANVNLSNTNLCIGREDIFNNSNLILNSGTLNMVNNQIGNLSPKNLTINGDTNIYVDVDLANSQMDRISAQNYGEHTGNILVSGMNVISDLNDSKAEVLFADSELKDFVVNNTESIKALNPIYQYDVRYDNRDDAGYFVFEKGSSNRNSYKNYNPSVLATPSSVQSGGQSVINETIRFSFQHMDTFSQIPFAQRMAIMNRNKYAILEGNPKYSADLKQLDKGYFVKPFTSFEKIHLNNGPAVDAITYGTIIGLDSEFKELRHGWYNVQSVYAGYNGSQLSYHGVDTTLNGGLLGLTETFYKGNFFTALTATAGGAVATSSTMYGNDDYSMLMGGIGSKSGYNIEFQNGKYILQPIMMMNYSFVNTFDYTNAAGVKIESDPLHSVQLNPQLKFVCNLANGWQPYASVGMVWNVLNSSKVKANDVVLPKMTVDPYVEYGVGVERNWKDRFTGFVQAMVAEMVAEMV